MRAPAKAPAPAPIADAAVAKRIRGWVFTDDEHRAPADLAIAVDRSASLEPGHAPELDVVAATWSLELAQEEGLTLWVTSASTVPSSRQRALTL